MNQNGLHVIDVLHDHDYSAVFAGGCVRDVLLGKEPKDWDIATEAHPKDVKRLFPKVIETGLQHGTVTVVHNDENFEVTTFRKDRVTDGRRATVSFDASILEDSERRDFTMNAMYMTRDGTIIDFHGGQEDLKNGIVRFVGNAEDRIKEDYLRILRYFRFIGRLKNPIVDLKTLEAIRQNALGLKIISGERIWMELKQILEGEYADFVVGQMMLAQLGDFVGHMDVHHLKKAMIQTKDAVLRYCSAMDMSSVPTLLVSRFKASSVEVEKSLEYINVVALANAMDFYGFMCLMKKTNNSAFVMETADLYSNQFPHLKNWTKFISQNGTPPWPVTGDDLLKEGFSGKILGYELDRRRREWLDDELTKFLG